MEFTDERIVPSCYWTHRDLFYWHLSRYHFARSYIQRDDRVLDVACGIGYGSYEVALLAKHVVGVDIDKESIDYALTAFKSPNIKFIAGNCVHLSSLLDEQFNVCVSFETLEHLTQQDQHSFLRELSNLLVDDGLLIVSTPNIDVYNPANSKNHNRFHPHELKLEELRDLLNLYFGQVLILGQKLFEGANNKYRAFRFVESLRSIRKLRFNSIFNPNANVQLSDFEFSITDIEKSLIFIAICRYPKTRTNTGQGVIQR